jgi:hypothetical protein
VSQNYIHPQPQVKDSIKIGDSDKKPPLLSGAICSVQYHTRIPIPEEIRAQYFLLREKSPPLLRP